MESYWSLFRVDRSVRILAVCVALVLGASPGHTQLRFALQNPIPVLGLFPSSATTLDIDGDGDLDVLVTTEGSGLELLENDGRGVLTSLGVLSVGGVAPVFVTTADLDNDGKPDVIVVNSITDDLSVFRNVVGEGQATPLVLRRSSVTGLTLPGGSYPVAAAAADFNNDGRLDLAVAGRDSHSTSIFIQQPNGTFLPQPFSGQDNNNDGQDDTFFQNSGCCLFPHALAPGDVDNNGSPDLAIANVARNSSQTERVQVLVNNGGNAPFSTDNVLENGDLVLLDSDSIDDNCEDDNAQRPIEECHTFSVAAAHLARTAQTNRPGPDPRLDFVIANEFDRSISILENNGNNTFTRRQVLDTNDNPFLFPVFVAVDDMDRDGDHDIVAVDRDSNRILVLENTGNNTFAQALNRPVRTPSTPAFAPVSVAIADLDGDCDLDLITANHDSDNVSVFLNRVLNDAALSACLTRVSTGQPYALDAAALNTATVNTPLYIDRPGNTHAIVGSLPQELRGGMLVRTANDDKAVTTDDHLRLVSREDVVVYVAYDARASSPPLWLTNAFTPRDTTLPVIDSDPSLTFFRLFRRQVAAGESIVLGGNNASGASGAGNHYAVIVQPAQKVTCDGLLITIFGDDNDNVIEGTPGDDVIAGLRGSDVINGGGGNDTICGGPGSDEIAGGGGNDVIFGEGGADTLRGNGGNDRLFGEDGNDILRGGPGADFLDGALGNDRLFGDESNDLLRGGPGDDELRGGPGDDTCNGQSHVNGDTATGCETRTGVP